MSETNYIPDLPQWLQALTGLASIVILIYVYKLNRRQNKDLWLKTFNNLQQKFWKDKIFRQVRSWLACTEDYRNVEKVLVKRISESDTLTTEEYAMLEKLDCFFGFLLKVKLINPEFKYQKDLWDELYFQYWVDKILMAERYHIWIYYMKYFSLQSKQILNIEFAASDKEKFMAFQVKCSNILQELNQKSDVLSFKLTDFEGKHENRTRVTV